VRNSQTVRGVVVWEPWVLPRALDFIARRRDRYPFGKIVSDVLPFDDLMRAFRVADAGGPIRVSLRMAS
jgi:hypothetical protein